MLDPPAATEQPKYIHHKAEDCFVAGPPRKDISSIKTAPSDLLEKGGGISVLKALPFGQGWEGSNETAQFR